MIKEKISEKLYKRYEYLANKYAGKIFSYEELSFEYEDLIQEFKIKIFTSIKAYGRRWSKFRRNQASKPVPLKYYLEAACSNKMRDFIKYINRENHKSRIDEINYDFGVDEETKISPSENLFEINGINLLEGLSGKDKIVFSLFLKGHPKRLLNKVYLNKQEKSKQKEIIKNNDIPFQVNDIIDMQRNFLIKKYGNELLQKRTVYSSYNLED